MAPTGLPELLRSVGPRVFVQCLLRHVSASAIADTWDVIDDILVLRVYHSASISHTESMRGCTRYSSRRARFPPSGSGKTCSMIDRRLFLAALGAIAVDMPGLRAWPKDLLLADARSLA